MTPPPQHRQERDGATRQEGAGATQTSLQGTIDLVTYHDESSLYTVLRIAPETGFRAPPSGELFQSTRITAVGRVAGPAVGLRVRLIGEWGTHPKHGQQFEFEGLEVLPPIDVEGLVRYLSSKVFEGIGETIARRIVAKLGPGTLATIRDDPESLKGIRGLRADVAEGLAEKVRAQLLAHQTGAFLRGLGLGPLQSQAVITALGVECEASVRRNPYRIAGVPGLGFVTADGVARQLGFAEDDPRRLAAGALHAMKVASNDGHSLLRLGDLVTRATELLSGVAPRAAFIGSLAELEEERDLVFDRELVGAEEEYGDEVLVYLPWLFASEAGLAENLAALTGGDVHPLADDRRLAVAEREAGIDLHPSQREAVLRLLCAPVALLTGGPGVGKTTIIRLVAALSEAAGAKVLLASPTGRAAKRLAEATGQEASTIHRMLGFNAGTGGFAKDAEHPLDAGVVIIDEISMLDVVLAHHLVKAVRSPTRLVLVGDPNQLPSVGPGNVLADLIASKRVPVSRLTQIFRQEAKSLIVANAHRILQGETPIVPEKGDTSRDFYFFGADGPAATADRLVEVVTQRIPEVFGFDWQTDVQVIAPMYKGECGVDAINDRLREAQAYGGREVRLGKRTWRIGDRVIHTRNDYEKEVFNGDMGRIVSVSQEGLVTVRYPEQDVVYSGADISDLMPAFAITVHRSQGGEFPVVVMPLVPQHYVMLQRNLLYTAITRAQKLVVLVGSRRALQMAVDNADQQHRESALAERLARAT